MSHHPTYPSSAAKQRAYRDRKAQTYDTSISQWNANRDAEQQRLTDLFNLQCIRLTTAYKKLAAADPRYLESVEKSLPAVGVHFVTLRMFEWTDANPRPVRPRL